MGKFWMVSNRGQRPSGGARYVNVKAEDLEPYYFAGDEVDPADRKKAAQKLARQKLQTIWGFSVGPLEELPPNYRKLEFPLIFRSELDQRVLAELRIRVNIVR